MEFVGEDAAGLSDEEDGDGFSVPREELVAGWRGVQHRNHARADIPGFEVLPFDLPLALPFNVPGE